MSQTMYLVRMLKGQRWRGYRINPLTLVEGLPAQCPVTEQHRPRAWWIQPADLPVIGIAAIGHSIDQCHQLIERLCRPEQQAAAALREVQ